MAVGWKLSRGIGIALRWNEMWSWLQTVKSRRIRGVASYLQCDYLHGHIEMTWNGNKIYFRRNSRPLKLWKATFPQGEDILMGALQTLCLANCYWRQSLETWDLRRTCRKLTLINHERKKGGTVKVLYTCIINFPMKVIFEYDTEENDEKYKSS